MNLFSRRSIRRLFLIVGIGATTMAVKCPKEFYSAGFSLSVTSAEPAVLVAGGSATVTLGIARLNSYAGGLTLRADPASGLSLRQGPVTVPDGATSATVIVDAASGTPAGAYQLLFSGEGDGILPATVNASFNVVTPSYALQAETASLNLTAGGPSKTEAITINRSHFTGAVTVAATSDAGISVTAVPSTPTTTTSVVLTISATLAAAAGSHTVTVTGASSLAAVSTTFTVVVNPVSSVVVTPLSSTRAVSQTQQYSAVANDAAGNPVLPVLPTTWRSSASTIATVSATGLVTAVGAGSATIFGSISGVETGAPFTVLATAYNLTPASTSLNIARGSAQTNNITITRVTTTTAVAVSAVSDDPTNITVTANPSGATNTNSVILTITVGVGASLGSHTITVTGLDAPLPNVVTTFTVVVGP